MTLEIVSILPELLDANGDAQNAKVLAARARWAGLDAAVVRVSDATALPEHADAVVIGSGSDASLAACAEVLHGMQQRLREWSTVGVPILAIGTGWELLSWGIELADGSVVEGLGILPGRAVPRSARTTGDLVVKSPRFGTLVGFENRHRDYVQAEGSPLGRVLAGVGNGRGSAQEGVVMGETFGTHLHGPVLAKNPAFADALLGTMAARAGLVYEPGEEALRADIHARQARAAILAAESLGE
ncbi:type 1 glutamine amidotransferase [Agromyces archimandritae]|uniref:Lipid II isoglutaminyl synthase (glutamine-hydrolyzing) subunit GatD n=1 Tax=Agromyces archimandritae TaxID=2781962 RepID=A0A975INP3_9MICO|nr:cobyric acid synthase [Agromyces archimandritae]QTX04808.1 cobyric acid synthase [Agromyces archimandritae]